MAFTGLNPDSNFGSEQSQGSAFYGHLVTLIFVGTGLLLQKLLNLTNLRKDFQKNSMSMIGISMLIFWSLPSMLWKNLPANLMVILKCLFYLEFV